ncbi:MAG: Arc family DNA-binding protein [Desulfobacterales bacterium]|nr:Arc family DNA-binding protein [Desulfobacterales bacterium]
MATVTVKNIPDNLYERLKAVAGTNRRSINNEIIVCIEHVVASRRVDPAKVLENARHLRELTAGHPIRDTEFNRAKSEGRR